MKKTPKFFGKFLKNQKKQEIFFIKKPNLFILNML